MIELSIRSTLSGDLSARVSKTRTQTPALAHLLKRLQIVVDGPKHSGRSRQGEPVRSTQKIPFSTRRSSTRATPRGLFGKSG
jgi:hypothetical protein